MQKEMFFRELCARSGGGRHVVTTRDGLELTIYPDVSRPP